MKKVIYALMIILTTSLAKAQETDFSLGADFVSSYVWRGAYQTSAAIQPGIAFSVSGFSLSAWGSVPFQGAGKEVDFSVGYEIAGLSLMITDYWWEGEDVYKYFTYGNKKTAHHFEATVEYELPVEKFPLRLSWNTMFAGEDFKGDNYKRAYSTYISASYPFKVKDVDLGFSMGITPWEGMYSDDFSVLHIGLKASKEIKITDSFSLPVFGEIIANPKHEDIFFVFGISL